MNAKKNSGNNKGKVEIIPPEKTNQSPKQQDKSADSEKKLKAVKFSLYELILRASIRVKISVLIIFMICLSVVVMGIFFFNMIQNALEEEITAKAETVARDIADTAYGLVERHKEFIGDYYAAPETYGRLDDYELSLKEEYNEIGAQIRGKFARYADSGLVYGEVVSADGVVLVSSAFPFRPDDVSHEADLRGSLHKAHPRMSEEEINAYIRELKRAHSEEEGFVSYVFQARTNITYVAQNITNKVTRVLDISVPIVYHGNRDVFFGYTRIGVDYEIVQAQKRALSTTASIVLVISILISMLGAFYLANTMTKPLLEIIDVMKKVSNGDLDQRVSIGLKDEIGELADNFNLMVGELREKFAMQRYVSKSAISHIKAHTKDSLEAEMGGVKKIATLWFSDIRGFTAFSENRKPETVIKMLNKYLSIQAEIIKKNNGDVDKFVGDEVMAVFNTGDARQDALNAVKAGLEIQRKVYELNKVNIKQGYEIKIGCGINTGECVMGNMGSKDRMDYTVLGDAVNTAARIEAQTPGYRVNISEGTYWYVKKECEVSKPGSIKAKGKTDRVTIYTVLKIIDGGKTIVSPHLDAEKA